MNTPVLVYRHERTCAFVPFARFTLMIPAFPRSSLYIPPPCLIAYLHRFLAVVIPGGAYLIPVSLRTDPATEDPSLYALRNDGTASPAAVGTLGIKNALPPEMRQKTMNPGAGGGGRGSYQGVVGNKNSAVADKKPIACGQCVKPFKWTLKGTMH